MFRARAMGVVSVGKAGEPNGRDQPARERTRQRIAPQCLSRHRPAR